MNGTRKSNILDIIDAALADAAQAEYDRAHDAYNAAIDRAEVTAILARDAEDAIQRGYRNAEKRYGKVRTGTWINHSNREVW